MKKIMLLAAVVSVASFASCKKAATCECTTTVTSYTENGVNILGTQSQTTVETRQISKTDKKTAAAMCGNSTTTDTQSYTSGGSSYTDIMNSSTTCAIK